MESQKKAPRSLSRTYSSNLAALNKMKTVSLFSFESG